MGVEPLVIENRSEIALELPMIDDANLITAAILERLSLRRTPKPAPDVRFVKRLTSGIDNPEIVEPGTWMEGELNQIADSFRRELGFPLIARMPLSGANGESWLLTDPHQTYGTGTIVGGCGFLWGHGPSPAWNLSWVWISPHLRRRGILSRYWPRFRARYGQFALQPPLSPAMAAFARKQGYRNDG